MNLIDSSLWIDYFRPKTPAGIKQRIHQIVMRSDVVTCEPVLFELLRSAATTETRKLRAFFFTIPVLSTPAALWTEAGDLGRRCFQAGFSPPAIDLLIAQVALHHGSLLSSSDEHFMKIAAVSGLKVNPFRRASEKA